MGDYHQPTQSRQKLRSSDHVSLYNFRPLYGNIIRLSSALFFNCLMTDTPKKGVHITSSNYCTLNVPWYQVFIYVMVYVELFLNAILNILQPYKSVHVSLRVGKISTITIPSTGFSLFCSFLHQQIFHFRIQSYKRKFYFSIQGRPANALRSARIVAYCTFNIGELGPICWHL